LAAVGLNKLKQANLLFDAEAWQQIRFARVRPPAAVR
jgi:hypothetical protein